MHHPMLLNDRAEFCRLHVTCLATHKTYHVWLSAVKTFVHPVEALAEFGIGLRTLRFNSVAKHGGTFLWCRNEMAGNVVPTEAEVVAAVGIGAHLNEGDSRFRTGVAADGLLVFPVGEIPKDAIATGIDEIADFRNVKFRPQDLGENNVFAAHQGRNQGLTP